MNYELYHHGIKGQRWGIRRTKEQLGYYVSKVKKQHAENVEKRKIARTKKDEEKRLAADKRFEKTRKGQLKKLSKMSDEELRAATNRNRLETDYLRSVSERNKSLPAEQVSIGKRVTKSIINDMIVPAAKSTGKSYIEKSLKDLAGVSVDNSSKKNEDKGKNPSNNQNDKNNKDKKSKEKIKSSETNTSKEDIEHVYGDVISEGKDYYKQYKDFTYDDVFDTNDWRYSYPDTTLPDVRRR